MSNPDFIGIILEGLAFWILPAVYPLFFIFGIQRKVVFYFVGLACSFLCFKLSPVFWGFFCAIVGPCVALLRHEDYQKGIEYSFALVASGLSSTSYSLSMTLVPVLALGSLLSLIALRLLKNILFKSIVSPPVQGDTGV